MTWQGWAEIALTIGLAVALAWPLGTYLAAVLQGGRTWLDPVLRPVERLFHAAAGVDPRKGQDWVGYTASLLAFNAAGFVLLYLILRGQGVLPLNPLHLAGMSPHLAFDTAVSFVTNTDWQSYAGETAVSNGAQMAGLAVQNFVSAATGLSGAAALAPGSVQSASDPGAAVSSSDGSGSRPASTAAEARVPGRTTTTRDPPSRTRRRSCAAE